VLQPVTSDIGYGYGSKTIGKNYKMKNIINNNINGTKEGSKQAERFTEEMVD